MVELGYQVLMNSQKTWQTANGRQKTEGYDSVFIDSFSKKPMMNFLIESKKIIAY
jgi:hypothetical protein